jgi:hypothetical protein
MCCRVVLNLDNACQAFGDNPLPGCWAPVIDAILFLRRVSVRFCQYFQTSWIAVTVSY